METNETAGATPDESTASLAAEFLVQNDRARALFHDDRGALERMYWLRADLCNGSNETEESTIARFAVAMHDHGAKAVLDALERWNNEGPHSQAIKTWIAKQRKVMA